MNTEPAELPPTPKRPAEPAVESRLGPAESFRRRCGHRFPKPAAPRAPHPPARCLRSRQLEKTTRQLEHAVGRWYVPSQTRALMRSMPPTLVRNVVGLLKQFKRLAPLHSVLNLSR